MGTLELMMYVEIDIMCLVLLVYVGIKSFKSVERRKSQIFFRCADVALFSCVASDLVWILMENHVIPAVQPLPHAANLVYFASSVAVTASWFLYTETELDTGWLDKLWVNIAFIIPITIEAILLLGNFYTRYVFYFGPNDQYIRGPLNWIVYVVPNVYLAVSSVHAAWMAMRKENYVRRKAYLSLASFSLYAVGACLIQFFQPGSPLPCIGITMAIFMVHMSTRERQISVDPLTRLNNRYHMVQYLTNKMDHRREGEGLYLLLIDLDKFKQINDAFGHVEGDKALVRVAEILRQTASTFNCFAARYGGDEFVLICEGEDAQIVADVIDCLNKLLKASNTRVNAQYVIDFSIGWAEYNSKMRYVPDFIAEADKALYQVKSDKKRIAA